MMFDIRDNSIKRKCDYRQNNKTFRAGRSPPPTPNDSRPLIRKQHVFILQ